jgi:hypothetical protein
VGCLVGGKTREGHGATVRVLDASLWENRCMAGLLRLNPGSLAEDGWLLFANPHHLSERRNLSVKLSRDEGATAGQQDARSCALRLTVSGCEVSGIGR